MENLKFGYMVGNGNKSVDRKIQKLIAYVEKSVNTYPNVEKTWKDHDVDRATWAIKTIEQGVHNIIDSSFAYLTRKEGY